MRPQLLQFVVPNSGVGVWLPATEGVWEWCELHDDWHEGHNLPALGEPKRVLVRGCGPRGDDALCAPVTTNADGTTVLDTEQVKSVRQLPAGYWTFLRGLRDGDPEIPGA